MQPLMFFVVLQLFDSLTTLLGFKMGLGEGNPVVRSILPSAGPILGVVLSKVAALGLVVLCIQLNRRAIIGKINRWYVALILWNFANICYVAIAHPWG